MRETNNFCFAAALRAVTNERIAEAAQSMTLDTVYFLTGEDSKDE